MILVPNKKFKTRQVLSIQGEQIEAFAKVRGMKKCESKMIEAIQADIASQFANVSPEKVRVHVAGTLQRTEDIKHWKDSVQNAFPMNRVEYFPLPCSIAVHVGPGCLGIAAVAVGD